MSMLEILFKAMKMIRKSMVWKHLTSGLYVGDLQSLGKGKEHRRFMVTQAKKQMISEMCMIYY